MRRWLARRRGSRRAAPGAGLCLSQDQGQAHAQEQAQHLGPEHRQGARGVGRLTQVQDLAAGDSCATIHDGGLLPEVS